MLSTKVSLFTEGLGVCLQNQTLTVSATASFHASGEKPPDIQTALKT